MEMSDALHDRVQVMVNEYSGALAPGRVIAIAVGAAAQLHRRADLPRDTRAFLDHWEESARRRLSDQVAQELASVRRADGSHELRSEHPDGLVAAGHRNWRVA